MDQTSYQCSEDTKRFYSEKEGNIWCKKVITFFGENKSSCIVVIGDGGGGDDDDDDDDDDGVYCCYAFNAKANWSKIKLSLLSSYILNRCYQHDGWKQNTKKTYNINKH